jgi:pyrimidine operon attenuation protein/uracil phosphoribosyltransferase
MRSSAHESAPHEGPELGYETNLRSTPLTSEVSRAAPLTPLRRRLASKLEMGRPERTILLDARALSRALQRMAVEVLELTSPHGTGDLVLIGIQRRGVELADRIAKLIEKDEGVVLPRGALDITLYRDDLETVGPKPVIGETRIPGDLGGKHVVIVDDVLYTGRTVRAALDELTDFGRPKRISLCVLVDRGGRELPIHPDVVGKQVKVNSGERVDVLVEELDGRDEVDLVRGGGARE